MARIKEFRLYENGDFDIVLSFSNEDINKIGRDTRYHMERPKDLMNIIWQELKKEIKADDRRTWDENDSRTDHPG